MGKDVTEQTNIFEGKDHEPVPGTSREGRNRMENGEEKKGCVKPKIYDMTRRERDRSDVAEGQGSTPMSGGGFEVVRSHRAFDRDLLDLEEAEMQPQWSVPWSDLMMIAFIMFAVLFILSASKRDFRDAFKEVPKKEAAAAQTAEPRPTAMGAALPAAPGGPDVMAPSQHNVTLEQLYELSQKAVGDQYAKDASVMMMPDHTLKLSVSESMLFDLGKADVKPGAAAFLREFAKVLDKTKFGVRIEGHTDSYPIRSPQFPTNWELSAVRAVNVARFLIEECRLAPKRFSIAGYSMYKPLVADATPEGKAKNRRVEIIVMKESPVKEESAKQ